MTQHVSAPLKISYPITPYCQFQLLLNGSCYELGWVNVAMTTATGPMLFPSIMIHVKPPHEGNNDVNPAQPPRTGSSFFLHASTAQGAAPFQLAVCQTAPLLPVKRRPHFSKTITEQS